MTSLTVEPTLLEKYATSAPRYTSYPTAVDWGSEFDPSSYPARLSRAATRTTEPLSVYLHIPFCQEMCLFCGCNVVITRKQEKVARYLDHLEHELEMIAASNVVETANREPLGMSLTLLTISNPKPGPIRRLNTSSRFCCEPSSPGGMIPAAITAAFNRPR